LCVVWCWGEFLFLTTFREQEIHVIHTFENDFYDSELRAIVCEYIRPERNFGSLDELVAAIKADIALAQERTADVDDYRKLKVRSIDVEL
jgi:riboflavin kinase